MTTEDRIPPAMDDKEWSRISRRLQAAAKDARRFLDEQDKRLAEIRAMGRSPR